MINGKPAPTFDETMGVHMARCHPDPIATKLERQALEAKLAETMKKL